MGLRKHESATLTQIRTGKIGLRAFLMQRCVPSITTPLCRCGTGPETQEHLVVHCPDLRAERHGILGPGRPPPRTRRDFAEASWNPRTGGTLAKWVLRTGRLTEYQLAQRLAGELLPQEPYGPHAYPPHLSRH